VQPLAVAGVMAVVAVAMIVAAKPTVLHTLQTRLLLMQTQKQ